MNTHKILLFFIVLLFTYSVKAQNLLTEGFEDSFPPTEWTILNLGAQTDGETWIQNTNNHSGSHCAFSQDGAEGFAMEEWLITSAITVPANSYIEISFWHMFKWYAFNDGPEYVMISTTGTDPANFTDTVYTLSIVGNADWEQVLLNDISNYSEQTIYVAFVHTSANGYADAWLLDDISIDAYETGETDIGVLSIITPEEYSTANIAIHPLGKIKNFGTANITDDFQVNCEIKDSSSTTVYSSSITYTDELAVGETAEISYTDTWTPTEEGVFTINLTASLTGDVNSDNNSITSETEVVVHHGTGGPDNFGYQWIDSDVEGGPEYNWIEISETGTSTITYGVSDFYGDDNFSEPIEFGFDFPFYGKKYSSCNVDINGEILLETVNTWYDNYPAPGWHKDGNMFNYYQPIPGFTSMPALVAVYWDNLVADEGIGDIYFQNFGEEPNRYCVIEWHNLRFDYGDSEDTTLCFEAIFYEKDSSIVFQYKNTAIGHSGSFYPHDNGKSAAVGIQNNTCDMGLSYLFEIIDEGGLYHGVEPMGNILHNELAIKFYMGVDSQPPVFTHNAIGNTFSNTPEFSVKLTDMSGILYDSLYYNIGEEWLAVGHYKVETDTFYYVLPEMAKGTSIKYYFAAVDNSDANNRGVFPENGQIEYNSFNILPTSNDVKILLAYSGSEDYNNTEYPVYTDILNSINVDYDIYNWEEYDEYRITDNYDVIFLYSANTGNDEPEDSLGVAMMDFLDRGTVENPKNIFTASDEMAGARHPLPNSSSLNKFYSAYIRGGYNPQVNPPYNGGTDGIGGPDNYGYSEGSIIGVDGSPIGELDVELEVYSNTPDVIRSGGVPSWYEEEVTNPEIISYVAYRFETGPISGDAYCNGGTSAIWLDNLIYKSYFMSFDLSQIKNSDDREMIITDALKWFGFQVSISATANPVEGGTVTGDGTYNNGETAELIATQATGYDFVNWTEGETEVSTDATYSFVVTDFRTLVANFELQSFTIEASVNPAESGTITGIGSYNTSETAELIATAEIGYGFVNWTEAGTEVSTEAAYSFLVTEDRTLVANFVAKPTFTISASVNSAEGGTVTGDRIYTQDETCNLIATAEIGYGFVNWTEAGTEVSTEAAYSFTVTEDRTLVANFVAKPTFTISASVNPAEGGAVTGDRIYTKDETCALTATPATGYSFVNWTEAGTEVSKDTIYSFTVTEGRTLVANFSNGTSVININNDIAFKVYPNPATDIITFEKQDENNLTFKIINITGVVVMRGGINENIKQIDISQIPSGAYIIFVGNGTDIKTINLLKQ